MSVSERKRVFYLASRIFCSNEEAFNGNYTLSRKAIKGERRPLRKNNVVIIQNTTKSIEKRMMSRHEDGGNLGRNR